MVLAHQPGRFIRPLTEFFVLNSFDGAFVLERRISEPISDDNDVSEQVVLHVV